MSQGQQQQHLLEPQDLNQWQILFSETEALVVMFTATWCQPCKKIKPLFEKMSQDKRYQKTGMYFVLFDVDRLREVEEIQRDVKSIPMFKCFFRQRVCEQPLTGADENQLRQLVDSFYTHLQPVDAHPAVPPVTAAAAKGSIARVMPSSSSSAGANSSKSHGGVQGNPSSSFYSAPPPPPCNPVQEALLELVIAQGMVHLFTSADLKGREAGRLALDKMVLGLRNWKHNPSLIPPKLLREIQDTQDVTVITRLLTQGLTAFIADLEAHMQETKKSGTEDPPLDFDVAYSTLMNFSTFVPASSNKDTTSSSRSN